MSGNGNGIISSAIYDMEMTRLDQEIEKTRKQFYTALMGKKRRVKRKWLEISSMTNAHLLQTLPYRAMLGHVAKLADERDKFIAEVTGLPVPLQEESENTKKEDDEKDEQPINDKNGQHLQRMGNTKPEVSALAEDLEGSMSIHHKTARDEAIQTVGSSFLDQS